MATVDEIRVKVGVESDPPATQARPGIRTSEFWVTILLQVLGLIALQAGERMQSEVIVAIATAIMGANGLAYTTSRGVAKKGASGLVDLLRSGMLTTPSVTPLPPPTPEHHPHAPGTGSTGWMAQVHPAREETKKSIVLDDKGEVK